MSKVKKLSKLNEKRREERKKKKRKPSECIVGAALKLSYLNNNNCKQANIIIMYNNRVHIYNLRHKTQFTHVKNYVKLV